MGSEVLEGSGGRAVETGALLFEAAGRRASSMSLAELVQHTGAELDATTLAPRVLNDVPLDASQTPYEGITCRERHRDETPASSSQRPRTVQDAPAFLARELRESVARALTGVRRVAVMTGGGLDSGGLLALAVEWAARTPGASAFAVALDFDASGDDRPHLRALEAHLQCDVLRVRPEEAAARLSLVRGVDAATFGAATAPMEVELMARARAYGAECVLCGAGGDDLFDGDPRSLALLARSGRIAAAVRTARDLPGGWGGRSPVFSGVVRRVLRSLVPRHIRAMRARFNGVSMPTWAGPALIAWLTERAMRLRRDGYADEGRAALARARADEAYRVYLAWNRHQEGVAADVPRRDPYLDRRLVAEVSALPAHWLLHGARWRGLYREAMRELLPESLRLRQDKSRFEPALARFLTEARATDLLRDLGSVACLAARGLVVPRLFERELAAFAASPATATRAWLEVWPALCAEAFLRARGEGVT
jgi:asparagine synthase (glutamine-hydrolysing)